MGDEIITDNKDGTVSIKGTVSIGSPEGFIVGNKIFVEIWPGAAIEVGHIEGKGEKE